MVNIINHIYKVTKNNFIKDQARHAGCYYEEAILVDDHPAFIINYKDKFMPWGVKNIDNGVYNFYESDREQAHTACWHNDCPYIYKGKMYKCGTVVGAQAFVKKYPVRQQDKDLYELKPLIQTKMNLELAPTEEMIEIAMDLKPEDVWYF